MSTNVFDIRTDEPSKIGKIVFANSDSLAGYTQAEYIIPAEDDDNCILIKDFEDHVAVFGKEHAQHLIKALEKAIELKWLV
jgi:hypothetical protein